MTYKNMRVLKFFLSNMYGIEPSLFDTETPYSPYVPYPPKDICELVFKTTFAVFAFPFMLIHFFINVVSVAKQDMKFGLFMTGLIVALTTFMNFTGTGLATPSFSNWFFLYFSIHLSLVIIAIATVAIILIAMGILYSICFIVMPICKNKYVDSIISNTYSTFKGIFNKIEKLKESRCPKINWTK